MSDTKPSTTRATTRSAEEPDVITGVMAHQGHGVQEPKGFWADAWAQVIRRRGAIMGFTWLSIIGFFAVFSPLIANGHPVRMTTYDVRTARDAGDMMQDMAGIPGGLTRSQAKTLLDKELSRHHPRLAAGDFLPSPYDATRLEYDAITLLARDLTSAKALDETGGVAHVTSPMVRSFSAADWLLMFGTIVGGLYVALPFRSKRGGRLGAFVTGAVQAGLIVVLLSFVPSMGWWKGISAESWAIPVVCSSAALLIGGGFLMLPAIEPMRRRLAVTLLVSIVAGSAAIATWNKPPDSFPYRQQVQTGEIDATFTIIPFSPSQRFLDRDAKLIGPGGTSAQGLVKNVIVGIIPPVGTATDEQLEHAHQEIGTLPIPQDARTKLAERFATRFPPGSAPTRAAVATVIKAGLGDAGQPFLLGTDGSGQSVASQLMHASRLAVSIGLVSSGIAVLIGVTIGALMGYFGGIVDLVLYRVVEIFMALPVLFILIVAAGLLPPAYRNTYVMMGIIGIFTWHGAARFTRAEFLKLRNQDFVQSARAVGLPLRSILFRHMLPNGITPVLVDATFLIAAAILAEAILSFLGLGPADQASWGKMLADATGEIGDFVWWMAIFPGFAIFLTVMSYNLIGESFRDAIDPKLKKARV